MENFNSEIFQNAVRAMTEAQAMAPGEELPERGQDSECAEWVQMYGGDAVYDLSFFPFHIALMSFQNDFLAGYIATVDDDVEVDEGLILVVQRLKK